MLSIDRAKQIGINACIDKIGRTFVTKHRGTSTSAFGETERGMFCFVGVDDRPSCDIVRDELVLDGESKFPYRASCYVNMDDGSTEFVDCVIPQ